MKPVEQTVLMPPGGNCFAACMASILELPLEQMPDFTPFDDWTVRWNQWLRPMNLAIMHCTLPADPDQQSTFRQTCMPGYTIPAADSPRGDWLHAVVALDGEVVWDPHPQRDMGLGPWREITFLFVINPTVPMQIGCRPMTAERLTRKAHIYREMVRLLDFSIWMWDRSQDWDDAREVMQKITAEADAFEAEASRLEGGSSEPTL